MMRAILPLCICPVIGFAQAANGGMTMRPIDADALNKKLHERVGSPESD